MVGSSKNAVTVVLPPPNSSTNYPFICRKFVAGLYFINISPPDSFGIKRIDAKKARSLGNLNDCNFVTCIGINLNYSS